MSLECVFKKHNRGRKRKNPYVPISTEMFWYNIDSTDIYRVTGDMHSDAAESPASKREYDPPVSSVHSSGGGGGGERGGGLGSRMPPPPVGGGAGAPSFWNRGGSPDRGIFSSSNVSRYPFMTLEAPRDLESMHAGPSRPPQPSIPQSMSLRSMVHPEPWEGDEEDSVYTDTELRHDDRDAERSPMDSRLGDNDHHRRPPSSHAYASNNGGQANAGDPVSLGYLTLEEAKTLFTVWVETDSAFICAMKCALIPR